MAALAPVHHARVVGSPWPGVFVTELDSGRHFGRHWHTTHGIGLMVAGAQRSASGLGSVDAFPGDLIATNPGEVHDGQPLGGPSRRWHMLYLDAGTSLPWSSGLGDHDLIRPVFQDPALRARLVRLFERLDAWTRGHGDRLACEESLVEVMAGLAPHGAMAPPREVSADVRRVRERLADVSGDDASLAELATLAGLGPFQLLRRFQKVYGAPPHAWRLACRAERARQLIRGGVPLADAAAMAGFADQSHLTRVFARQFGFTPGAWRRAVVA